jgi:isopentenyldiphosphate isomerase
MPLDNTKELFIWVDEQDNALGTITRGEAHDGSCKIHRAVMTLLVNEAKTKLLFQKRSQHKDLNPGKWSCGVGGHVDPGESYKQAIQRELQEEMGVAAISLQLLHKKLYDLGYEREMMAVFEARIHETDRIMFDETEVEAVYWCEMDSVSAFVGSHDMSPGIVNLLKSEGYLS